MGLISEIKIEHINRTKWINDNLTIRERSRIKRHTAIKIFYALIFYITMMSIMEMIL